MNNYTLEELKAAHESHVEGYQDGYREALADAKGEVYGRCNHNGTVPEPCERCYTIGQAIERLSKDDPAEDLWFVTVSKDGGPLHSGLEVPENFAAVAWVTGDWNQGTAYGLREVVYETLLGATGEHVDLIEEGDDGA